MKAGVDGEITFSSKAGAYNGSRCSLELTDVPQYTLIEFTVNYYEQPGDCVCNQVVSPNCSQIFIEMSGNNKSFCNQPSEPIYFYQSSEDNLTIVLSEIEEKETYIVNITYRSEFEKNTLNN